jgi:hypothetical protein
MPTMPTMPNPSAHRPPLKRLIGLMTLSGVARLRPSSTPLDTPRRTPMNQNDGNRKDDMDGFNNQYNLKYVIWTKTVFIQGHLVIIVSFLIEPFFFIDQ